VIGDLGISRIHDKATYERDQVTGTKATTPDYEPPEALNIVRRNSREEAENDAVTTHGQGGKPWSRKYDMWSLGCIFLEFAIWLIYDAEALGGFVSRRGQGPFYLITTPDNAGNGGATEPTSQRGPIQVCPRVKEAMEELRADERCSDGSSATAAGPLGQLVNLIEKQLLVTEAEGRCDANQLVNELKLIVEAAK